MSNQDQTLPVLIIGAGPVGLIMALLLKRQGIAVRLMDKKAEATKTSNALGIHARTLELLETIGLADKAIQRGLILPKLVMTTKNKTLFEVNFTHLHTKFPFILSLPQAETEALLTEELHALGGEIEWNTELMTIEQQAENMTVHIKQADQQQVIQARWIVGCDGYHSTLRELVHAEYIGTDLPQHFIMIDCLLDSALPQNQAQAVFSAHGGMLIFPMKDKWRLVAEISHDTQFKNEKTGNKAIFSTICNERCPTPITINEVLWESGFWIHERLSRQYRYDRIFLAGDAAHAHSPAGGQGLNTGIQDAFNLAWKLAQVIKGHAQENLLDTYQSERQPVARQVLKLSNHLTKLISIKNPLLIKLRDCLLPLIANKTKLVNAIAYHISELAISYPSQHKLIGQRAAAFNPNYQFLFIIFHNTAETEILIQFIKKQLQQQVQILHVQDFKENGGFNYWLVRPDQYIGFVGNTLTELEHYFLASFLNAVK